MQSSPYLFSANADRAPAAKIGHVIQVMALFVCTDSVSHRINGLFVRTCSIPVSLPYIVLSSMCTMSEAPSLSRAQSTLQLAGQPCIHIERCPTGNLLVLHLTCSILHAASFAVAAGVAADGTCNCQGRGPAEASPVGMTCI